MVAHTCYAFQSDMLTGTEKGDLTMCKGMKSDMNEELKTKIKLNGAFNGRKTFL